MTVVITCNSDIGKFVETRMRAVYTVVIANSFFTLNGTYNISKLSTFKILRPRENVPSALPLIRLWGHNMIIYSYVNRYQVRYTDFNN